MPAVQGRHTGHSLLKSPHCRPFNRLMTLVRPVRASVLPGSMVTADGNAPPLRQVVRSRPAQHREGSVPRRRGCSVGPLRAREESPHSVCRAGATYRPGAGAPFATPDPGRAPCETCRQLHQPFRPGRGLCPAESTSQGAPVAASSRRDSVTRPRCTAPVPAGGRRGSPERQYCLVQRSPPPGTAVRSRRGAMPRREDGRGEQPRRNPGGRGRIGGDELAE